MTVIVALSASALVAAAALGAGALSRGGAVAAFLVGSAMLFGTGWGGAAMLGAFFVSSTVVGRIAVMRGKALDPAGERRNARQVLANGGAGAAGALLEHQSPGLGFWIVCGSFAAAAADTWATSIGAFSRTDPRSLRTGRRVPVGTSGAVTGLGTWAGLAGALIVAAPGALTGGGVTLLVAGSVIGFGGMLLDSFLGATVQGRFECPSCGVSTEHRRHSCGTPARLVGGVQWLDNDGINALSTLLAALAAGLWWAGAR